MQVDNKLYTQLAAVFSYPSQQIYKQAEWLYSWQRKSTGSPDIESFHTFVADNRLEIIEELFTRTFDLNPSCCLEVGWHIYGEDYKRGEFLVNMRQSLEEEHLEESHELPDHMSHCLQLLPRLESEDAEVFVHKYLQPALAKVVSALEEDNPYTGVMGLLQWILTDQYGEVDIAEEEDVKSKLIELPVLNNTVYYDNREDRETYKSR